MKNKILLTLVLYSLFLVPIVDAQMQAIETQVIEISTTGEVKITDDTGKGIITDAVYLDLEESYKPGEEISIKVANEANQSIYYKANGCPRVDSCPFSYWIRTENGQEVINHNFCLPPPRLANTGEIQPGETKIIHKWDQKQWYEIQVPMECKSESINPGKYEISFTYYTTAEIGNGVAITIETEITICVPEGEKTIFGSPCCSGLKWIPYNCAPGELCPISAGYCTACGDGICKEPEGIYNCPEDCAPVEGEAQEPIETEIHDEGEKPVSISISKIETITGVESISIKKAEENKLSITTEGISAITTEKFILEESKLYIETSAGNKQVKVLPNTASGKAMETGIQTVKEIELKEEAARPVYSVKGTKQAKLFFLISVTLEIETNVSAETGEIISVKKPWWSFLAW